MPQPTIILIGNAAWVDVVAPRVRTPYRAFVYTSPEGYVARLTDDSAALILVDGDTDDWRFWVTTPKTSPATRRVPVILIAASDTTRDAALTAGADAALTPGELLDQLDTLLTESARLVTPELAAQMTRQCDEPLPPDALTAVEKFNAGDYYQQHDLFEALWMQETGPVRDLYRAILQVGIAYYQITRGNGRGALKMLLRSVQWLAILPDVCQGVDIAQLKADSSRVRAELERLGDGDIAQFDRALLKPIRLVSRAD